MKEVYIKYDPYEMISEMEIDGKPISQENYKGTWLEKVFRRNSMIPLQAWIDPIPTEGWDGLLAYLRDWNDDYFIISFEGRKADFNDLKESLEAQNSDDVAELEFPAERQTFIKPDREMKKAVDEVVEIMCRDKFREMVNREKTSRELKEKYCGMEKVIQNIKDRDFRVIFTGTYSPELFTEQRLKR